MIWDFGYSVRMIWGFSISHAVLKGYGEAGALDSEHESFYRRGCQLIEVRKEELLNPWDQRVLYP